MNETLPGVHASVTHDCTTVFGDHNVDTVTTAGELVSHNFTSEDSVSTATQTRDGVSTARRNASRNGVGATGAWILDAPLHLDGRRWAANRSRCTAHRSGITTSGISRCRGDKGKHGSGHTSGNQTTETVHFGALSCWKFVSDSPFFPRDSFYASSKVVLTLESQQKAAFPGPEGSVILSHRIEDLRPPCH